MKFYLFIYFLNFSLAEKSAVEERHLSRQKRLLFPQFTTLQVLKKIVFAVEIYLIKFHKISMCIIAQVSQLPDHRIAVNTGFQMNYQLPYQLSSWYSPMFWARKLSGQSNLLINFIERLAENDEDEETTTESMERKYGKFKRDVSAGDDDGN